MRKLIITDNLKIRFCFFPVLFFVFVFGARAQEYTFGYNLKKGDTFTQTTVADIKITQEAMGRTTDVSNVLTSTLSYRVAGVENDLISMEMNYDRVKIGLEMPGTEIEADSEQTDKKQTTERLAGEKPADEKTTAIASSFAGMSPMLKSITNIPITLVLSKEGELKEVRGVDKLQQSIARSVDGDSGQSLMAAQFSQQFNEEAVKNMAGQNAAFYFPGKPVKVGDSWVNAMTTRQSNIPMGATMKMTLLSVDKNIATLQVEAVYATAEDDPAEELFAKIKITGTQSGTMKIDLASGWAKESDMVQQIRLDSEINGMKSSQTSTGRITLTTVTTAREALPGNP